MIGGVYNGKNGKIQSKGWVPGKFVMTRAEAEIQALAPKVLEAKIKKWLQNTFS